MKEEVKVSIVIPVYNVECYLRECLDSVCNQTYKNIEIICVDDGSTDGSPAILKEYAEKDRRMIVLTQSNAGQAAARNAALEIATGEWVASIDSDDYFNVDAIEKCMQYAHEDVKMIHFGIRWFSDDGRKLNDEWLRMKHSGRIAVDEKLMTQLPCGPCDKFWKQSFLKEVGIKYLSGVKFEDLGYIWQLLSMTDYIYCLPEKIYNYRFRPGSTMKVFCEKKGGRKILDFLEVSRDCLTFWRSRSIRQRLGLSGPAYFELEILNRSRDRIDRWAADEFLHEAWVSIRNMIDEFELGSRLCEFPDLALYYHLPPYAYKRLKSQILHSIPSGQNANNARKEMILLANFNYIYWSYRRFQLLALLTFGKKRRKYKDKKRHFHELLRRCRQIKKEIRKNLS